MNDKIYMKELQHWDSEKFITFDMLKLTDEVIKVRSYYDSKHLSCLEGNLIN